MGMRFTSSLAKGRFAQQCAWDGMMACGALILMRAVASSASDATIYRYY